MKNIIISIATMLFACSTVSAQFTYLTGPDGNYSGGTGSYYHPYLISSAADMETLANNVSGGNNYSGKYFRLTNDLKNLDTHENKYSVITTMIGNDNNVFSGTFDGGGHVVYVDIDVSGKTGVGLFSTINGATIKNLFVIGNISHKGMVTTGAVGGICGAARNSSITYCSWGRGLESIKGNESVTYAGGICGHLMNSKVTNCCSSGLSIEGKNACGIGYISDDKSSITNCWNKSKISGTESAYGIARVEAANANNNQIITNCVNAGDILLYGYSFYQSGVSGNTAPARRISNGRISDCYSFVDALMFDYPATAMMNEWTQLSENNRRSDRRMDLFDGTNILRTEKSTTNCPSPAGCISDMDFRAKARQMFPLPRWDCYALNGTRLYAPVINPPPTSIYNYAFEYTFNDCYNDIDTESWGSASVTVPDATDSVRLDSVLWIRSRGYMNDPVTYVMYLTEREADSMIYMKHKGSINTSGICLYGSARYSRELELVCVDSSKRVVTYEIPASKYKNTNLPGDTRYEDGKYIVDSVTFGNQKYDYITWYVNKIKWYDGTSPYINPAPPGGYLATDIKADDTYFNPSGRGWDIDSIRRELYDSLNLSNLSNPSSWLMTQIISSCPGLYTNKDTTKIFIKSNCLDDHYPGEIRDSVSEERYTIYARTYFSNISQADADRIAGDSLETQGQRNANANGRCFFANKDTSAFFTKTDCPSGLVGPPVQYTIPAGKYYDTRSRYYADSLAAIELYFVGQAYANRVSECLYPNTLQDSIFTRSDCFPGSGSSEYYSIPPGTYLATTQAEADRIARDSLRIQGQANADVNGICWYHNVEKTDTFYRLDCAPGGIAEGIPYTVPARVDSSTVSQADADAKAQARLSSEGQAYANANGICRYYNTAQTDTFQRNNCEPGGTGSRIPYTVIARRDSSSVSQADADAIARARLLVEGQARANAIGICTYYNVTQSGTFTKQYCGPGGVGSSLDYTVAAGRFSSTISQSDADAQARAALQTEGQAYVNTNGTCIYPIRPMAAGTSATYLLFGSNQLTLTAGAGVALTFLSNGSVTGEGSEVALTASLATGYGFEGWSNGTAILSTAQAYTTRIKGAVSLTAATYLVPYTLTVNTGTGTTTVTKHYRDIITYTANPPRGQQLSHWTTEGITIPNAVSGTFSMPARNVTLTAHFKPATLTVSNIEPVDYNAGVYTPTPEVKDGTAVLTKDVDYTLSYANNINAGTATITVTGINDYANSTVQTPTFTISPIRVTLTGISPQSKVYDGTTAAPYSGTPVLSGVIGSDDVRIGNFTSAFDSKDRGTPPVRFTVTLIGAQKDNYWINPLVVHGVAITPAPLTVTSATIAPKNYDGTPAATVSALTFNGLISGETLTLNECATITAAFTDKDLGTGKPVQLTGVTFKSGSDNYTVSNLPFATIGDIIPKPITLTGITANDKVYDGTTDATYSGTPAFSSGAVIAGDAVSVDATAVTVAFDDITAGTRPVTFSGFALTGAQKDNYTLMGPSGSATILKKPVTISGISAEGKVYDGNTLATVQRGAVLIDGIIPLDNGNVEVDATTGTATFADKNAGTKKPVQFSGFTLTGAAATNYEPTLPADMVADITRRPVTIASISFADKVYDGTKTATVDNAAVQIANQVAGDNLTVLDATATFVDKNAGTWDVTFDSFTLGGTDKDNYELTAQPADVIAQPTITPKPVTLSGISANSRPYNGTTQATFSGAGTVVGKVEGVGDEVTVDASNGTATFADKNAGTGKSVTFDGFALTGTHHANYKISAQPAVDTATITPLPVMVTPDDNQSKTYKAVNPVLTYTCSPTLFDGDSFSGTLSRATTDKAGKYPIGIGTLTAGSNYTINMANKVFTITPKSITASTVTVANIAAQLYTGKAIKPLPKVTDGVTLSNNTDYTLTYSNNTDEGTATITIKGKGNYQDSRTVEFEIAKDKVSVNTDVNTGVNTDVNTGVNTGGNSATQIESVEATSVKLYPNPVHRGDIITIEGVPDGVKHIVIYDFTGRAVATLPVGSQRATSTTLQMQMPTTRGVYLVRVGEELLKVVVE